MKEKDYENKVQNKDLENEFSLIESMKEELEKASKSSLRMYNRTLKLLRKLDRVGRSLS
jgi:uncharacterized protein YecA (UPF0149 family)